MLHALLKMEVSFIVVVLVGGSMDFGPALVFLDLAPDSFFLHLLLLLLLPAPLEFFLRDHFIFDGLADEGVGIGPLDVLAVQGTEVGPLCGFLLDGRPQPGIGHEAAVLDLGGVGRGVVLLGGGVEEFLALGYFCDEVMLLAVLEGGGGEVVELLVGVGSIVARGVITFVHLFYSS